MLTNNEREKIDNLNSKNNYGLSDNMLKTLITQHKKARKENDDHIMELIEYRLTDINFHYECGLLSVGKYQEAYNSLK